MKHPGLDHSRWLVKAWVDKQQNPITNARCAKSVDTEDEAWSFIRERAVEHRFGVTFSISTPVREGAEFRHQIASGRMCITPEPAPAGSRSETPGDPT